MKDLIAEGRPPRIIALENVCGTLTSHEGKDFAAICSNFEKAGYVFGAVVIDAALFVPHYFSRRDRDRRVAKLAMVPRHEKSARYVS
jgi:DNA (cytosine-5)-methyltransferase 1